jgi:membrane protease YdiL (CAAX protease family)
MSTLENQDIKGLIPFSTGRNTLRDQVARHPLAAFFSLACTISWTCWFLMWLSDMGTFNGFGVIGGAGPALAAMIVSGILRPERSEIPPAKRWRFFGMAAVCALGVLASRRLWIVAGLTTVAGRGAASLVYPTFVAFLIDALAAAVVAFILSGIHSPRQGVHDLLHSLSLSPSRDRWRWFVMAVGLYPAVVVLGNFVSAAVGLPVPAPRPTGVWYALVLEVVLLFLYVLLGGGGLEEPGWRGFALPFLQKRYSPFRSSLFLAVIWAFWHWPLFWFGYYGGGPLGVFFYVLGVAPLAILFTAVFNRTDGSLQVAMLLHTSINVTPVFLTPTTLASGLWMLLILTVTIWMWRSPRTFALGHRKALAQGGLICSEPPVP